MDFNNEIDESKIKIIIDDLIKHFLSDNNLTAYESYLGLMLAANRLETLGPIFINEQYETIRGSFYKRIISDIPKERPRQSGILEQNRFITLTAAYLRDDGNEKMKKSEAHLALIKVYMGIIGAYSKIYKGDKPTLKRRTVFETSVNADFRSKSLNKAISFRLKKRTFYAKQCYNRDFFMGLRCLTIAAAVVIAIAKLINSGDTDSKSCTIDENAISIALKHLKRNHGQSPFIKLSIYNILQRQIADTASFAATMKQLIYGNKTE